MENASKALIIAGAILLAIIIISLGIMVVNNAKGQIGGANLNKEQVQAFNSQWENYAGVKSAAEVRALYSLIISNNNAEDQSGEKRFISVNYNSDNAATSTATTKPNLTGQDQIVGSKTYTVKLGYDTKTGLVAGVAIKAK